MPNMADRTNTLDQGAFSSRSLHACESCGQKFPSRFRAARHAQDSGHMANRYCQQCERLFDDNRTLKQHEKHSSHHKTSATGAASALPLSGIAQDLAATGPSSSGRQIPPPRLEPDIALEASFPRTVVSKQIPIRKRTRKRPPAPLSVAAAEETTQAPAASKVGQSAGNASMVALPPKVDTPSVVTAGSNLDTGKTEKPKDAKEEDLLRQTKPLVFSPPPIYPHIDIHPAPNHIIRGDNQYTLYPAIDQTILFEALKLRCHKEERLLSRRFIIHPKPMALDSVPKGIEIADFIASPFPSDRLARGALALDCEMVGILHGELEGRTERSELAQLCVVDVLTGEILIDKLVLPKERVFSWRTRYSGVSYPAILAAGKEGRLLRGWRAARAELLSYMDSDTILVGHDMNNDLNALRLAHSRVIDTAFQTAEVVWGDVDRPGRTWGLKELAKTLLGIHIQMGNHGHDCVEDTLATRELVLWCLRYPEELQSWAARMREKLVQQRIEREKRLAKDREDREEAKRKLEADEAGDIKSAYTQGWP